MPTFTFTAATARIQRSSFHSYVLTKMKDWERREQGQREGGQRAVLCSAEKRLGVQEEEGICRQ